MLKVIDLDTSSKKPLEFFDPSDSAEYSKVTWRHNIREKWSLRQDLSVEDKRKETLLPNIVKYCQLEPDCCENVGWLNDVWDNYNKVVYPTKIESTVTFGETTGYFVEVSGYTVKLLADFAEYTYLELIHGLRSVKAIVCESISDIKHFITILDKRDIETREEIYKVEMKLFDLYPNKQIQFSIYSFQNQKDLDIFIKNKKLLYFER